MVELADGMFLAAEANVRMYHFPPIGPHALAEDLAVEPWRAGHNVAIDRSVVEWIRRYHPERDGWHRSGSLHEAWS